MRRSSLSPALPCPSWIPTTRHWLANHARTRPRWLPVRAICGWRVARRSRVPDIVQRILGAFALVLSAPLVGGLALIVKIDSTGPAFYRAIRVGEGGRAFECLKLRTMAWLPGGDGPAITIDGDGRITRLGRVLRRFRLDELPQLINVARGEMNLVGPRPEDPRYVDFADPLHRLVFMAKPGITGLAQLTFVDEARWLGDNPDDADRRYRESVLPQKLAIDARYLRDRSWRLDASILSQTVRAVLGPRSATGDPPVSGPTDPTT